MGSGRMKRIADAREEVVAIPPIARIEPVPVELAVRAIPPEVQHIAVAVGVRKCTRYRLNHRPLSALGAESYPGSRLKIANPLISRTEYLRF